MYESFYNFKAEPFRLSPDHRFCFTHKSYAKAKAYMQYAIHRAEGFVMVTGKPGTGKTTLVNDLVDGLAQSRIVVATIVSTQLEADDLLRLVSCNFGLDVDAPNKAVVLQGLSVRLKRHHEEGTRALLIIDEAQDLSASALEELRLLTNLQLNNQPLLQIFLVGQENLRDLVQKPSMEQVHQRLVAACHLESLNEEDTKAYVRHRLDRVGWKDDPVIDEGVYPLVYQFSKGVPRRINLICSRFLLHGSVEEKHRIRASDVRTVVDELQHEQLAPVGFKGQLPPLMDDEEEESESQRAEGASESVVQMVPEDPAQNSDLSGGNPSSGDETESVEQVEEGPTSPAAGEHPGLEEDSFRVISLEDEVRREESNAQAKTENGSGDVIQQNYFSLDDSMEGSSEPIPIQKPSPASGGENGYGDRFANAQRQRQAQRSATRYYSEYQAGVSAQPGGSRKRGILGLAFIFALILGVVLVAIYMIRPQILQGEISYLEERVSRYLGTESASESEPGTEEADTSDATAVERKSSSREQESGAVSPVPGEHSAASPVESESRGENLEPPQVETLDEDALVDSPVTHAELMLTTAASDQAAAKKKVSPAQPEQAQVSSPESFPQPEDGAKSASTAVTVPILQSGGDGETALADPLATPGLIHQADADTGNNVGTSPPETGRPLPSSEQTSGEQAGEVSPDMEEQVLEAVNEEENSTRFASVVTAGRESNPAEQKKTSEILNPSAGEATLRLFFGSDSSEMSAGDRQKLERIIRRMANDPDAVAHIVGYADSTGDPEYNLALSFKRARVVADYLREKKIGAGRLRVEGRGVYSGPEEGDTPGTRSEQSQRQVTIDLLHESE
ncbi:MAG: AAA family ATPase [Sedimenticola sp.]|nr:AAA family ATPase [Sedimenticola sp.]